MSKEFKLNFEWNTRDNKNDARVGAMYCFKYCDICKN